MFIRLICIILFVFFSSCSKETELLTGVAEEQAIEVLTTLSNAGISAERIKIGSAKSPLFKILVESSQYQKALKIVQSLDLAHVNSYDKQFDEVTKQKGFTPISPEFLSLRYVYALSLRAEQALLALPGVIRARVVINRYDLNSQGQPISALALIRYTSQENLGGAGFSQSDVKEIVSHAVPGLSPDLVKVNLIRISLDASDKNFFSEDGAYVKTDHLHSLFWFRVPIEERFSALIQVLFYILISILAGFFGGLSFSSWRARRQLMQRLRVAKREQKKNLPIEH